VTKNVQKRPGHLSYKLAKNDRLLENKRLFFSARHQLPSFISGCENVVQTGCENCGAHDATSLANPKYFLVIHTLRNPSAQIKSSEFWR
jgi:hypothetical protein